MVKTRTAKNLDPIQIQLSQAIGPAHTNWCLSTSCLPAHPYRQSAAAAATVTHSPPVSWLSDPRQLAVLPSSVNITVLRSQSSSSFD